MGVSLDEIVKVNVELSVPTPASTDFSMSAIIFTTSGDSETIPVEGDVLLRSSYADQLAEYGYGTTSPLYKAVSTYFAQSDKLSKLLIFEYLIGSYESVEEAIEAARGYNQDFYSFCLLDSFDDISDWTVIESLNPPTLLFANIDTSIESGNIKRLAKIARYDEEETGVFPEVAFMGLCASMFSLDPNSAFTVNYKKLIGILADDAPESWVEGKVNANCNVFCKFGSSYSFTYPGILNNGYHIDEIFLADAARYIIQKYVIDGLTSARKIPQTDDGVTSIISMISEACNVLVNAGYISGGIWKGNKVGDLNTGDAIENGFYVYSGTVADQSQTDRDARKAPPIQVAMLASGAIEHVVISVYVNR